MTRVLTALLVTVLLTMLAVDAHAQQQQRQQRRGQKAPPHHAPYDVQTVETVRGVVARLDTMQGHMPNMQGLHAQVTTGDETLEVHLGPISYLGQQKLRVDVGDSLTVTGSRIPAGDQDAILSKSVQTRGTTWMLRDESGRPKWAGQRKGRGQVQGSGNGPGRGGGGW